MPSHQPKNKPTAASFLSSSLRSCFDNSLVRTGCLVALLILGLTVRLYRLDAPLADWHSWRQADTASVTREYLKGNAELLIPEYHDLSNIPSGMTNLDGYRMVEFPAVNLLTVFVLQNLPNLGLVATSRLISIIFSLLGGIFLFGFILRTSKKFWLAILTLAVYLLLPYSIYYSRVILPEPALVLCVLASFYFFAVWVQAQKNSLLTAAAYGLAWFFFMLALLLKPTAIFFVPVFLALSWERYRFKTLQQPLLWFFIATVGPLLAWRWWVGHFPTGIPANAWLLNGNGIRLRPAWWRWLFAERIAKLILGYWGSGFALLGLVGKVSDKVSSFDLITLSWALGNLSYLIVFATGNVQHDYYQIVLIPLLAVLVARGIYHLLTQTSQLLHPVISVSTVMVLCGLSLFLSWYEVKGYFNINNPAIVMAGQRVDALTPATAVVIAPYGGDTAFLFQTNRRGWPIGFDIDDKIDQGATTYVTTTYDDEARALEERFTTLEKTDQYLILDLTSGK